MRFYAVMGINIKYVGVYIYYIQYIYILYIIYNIY